MDSERVANIKLKYSEYPLVPLFKNPSGLIAPWQFTESYSRAEDVDGPWCVRRLEGF